METADIINTKYRWLRQSLTEAIGYLRDSNDRKGLEAFQCGIDDLEDVVQTLILMKDAEKINEVIPYVRMLDEAANNRDITGMTDILEYKIHPLAEKWSGGTETT